MIASLAAAVGEILLDCSSDPDHNRTVLTFAGDPREVMDAAMAAARVAVEKIDIGSHTGVHPRLGALDVLPFVPVEGASLQDCAEMANAVGTRLWDELGVPVYLYEAAGSRRLEEIRRHAGELAPDIGQGRHPTAGAAVVGARKFLIAWNIHLKTTDIAAARAIAREVRESGGGFPAVKALGLALESKQQVQVSINSVDFEVTPLHAVFDAVAESGRRLGVEIAGSELIGMIPAAALRASEGHDLRWLNLTQDLVLENRLKR